MKKLIALVLSVAMLVSCFAISISATAATAELVLQGAEYAAAGETYTVNVRLNDADDQVGGIQGTIKYEGASVTSIVANPEVLGYNKDAAQGTVITDDINGNIKFASVAVLADDKDNYDTKIWFKVTFTIDDSSSTATQISLADVIFSDKSANVLDGKADTVLTPADPSTHADLLEVGMLNAETADTQGVVVHAKVGVAAGDIKEYGVLFYPTQLITDDCPLAYDNDKVLKASLVKENNPTEFSKYLNSDYGFDATLKIAYTEKINASKFLGVKVSSVVYYVSNDGTVSYSQNSVDEYIQGGVANQAILNKALDIIEEKKIDDGALKVAISNINSEDDNTMIASRDVVLAFAVME